jgi:hypothetical protein
MSDLEIEEDIRYYHGDKFVSSYSKESYSRILSAIELHKQMTDEEREKIIPLRQKSFLEFQQFIEQVKERISKDAI